MSASDSGGRSGGRAAARALDALKRGWAVRFVALDGELLLVPVESALAVPDADEDRTVMLISAARAATLKLTNQRAAADPDAAVLIEVGEPLTQALARAIADPVLDLRQPMKGPFRALDLAATQAAEGAMQLARIAGILPAFHVVSAAEEAASVSAAEIADFGNVAHLQLVARAQLPVAASEHAEIVAFRSLADTREHIALIVGSQDDSVPVVRLHSECLTGDVLASLKCDCGAQLAAALAAMADTRWGVLLYLRQEGRGIGLVNKLRAYQLQDQGFDTVDANNRLGFPTEARDFEVAARMLDLLEIPAVRLMTNNPAKVAALEGAGIQVAERVPLTIPPNMHNERYLATKRDRTGHQL